MNPVAFTLFGKDVYWYGILIVAGMLLAMGLAKRDDGKYGLKWDDIFDYLMIAIVVGFVCARAYYVIFQWDYYKNNLSEIYQIWHGGIAIYGGIIGALVTAYFYCRKKKISFLRLCDYLAPYLPLVQAIGRWGNFFNREAYGAVTNSFLKMGIFDSGIGSYIFVHPTFLYESIWDFLIFIFLMRKRKKENEKGNLFYWYMFLYGLGRALIEGLRADSLYLFHVRISQVLALIFAAFFGIILLKQKFEKNSQKNIDKNG
ncbi:MAG: prolipoprotein diacylglyceryl transferase [Clostridia bacterium]|nr:prolipoprotein diacylglyceryl transferase [Clostridia bacterium]